jgi:hypothetical protein
VLRRPTWSELAFRGEFCYFSLVNRYLIMQKGTDLRALKPARGFEAREVTP